ncbi:hypothetical protein M514_09069 [Trichuris suis]|uniref:Reverse transcriptase domain-containing protein n=1 Tax=Trichuris suis TaxID=68888 RepID=A0A085N4J4_9BILA|nr:hypothetical protein M514_09069 [Trichuris suis]
MLPDVEPKFMKSRPVPLCPLAKVDPEIRRLVKDGVLEPVVDSKWATPLVCVLKRDGSVRVCADYRASVNPAISNNVYPLPTLDEAFAALAGGKCFTRLDLRNAYLQMPVDEASSNILTVNTPLGLHRVNRLPFGLKSAPAIFQRVMVSLLKDIEGVQVPLDDILISGSSQAEHWTRVYAVLQRLKEAGLRLKSEKVKSEANEVVFLGHKISPEGISPTEDKMPVDEASSNILTVNTPLGLHRVNRLPFGLKSAPAIFQRVMVSLLKDIEGVQVPLDDILISGSSQAEHWTRVYAVLQRLKEAGLRLKSEKCIFEVNEVVFLGHKISPEGISPTEDKVQAIWKAPHPKTKRNYKPSLVWLTSIIAPLYQLLKDNASWKWGTEQKNAFQRIKESLFSSISLAHYDSNRPLAISCDASSIGIGAVLEHINADGTYEPIYFASRVLQPSEQKYAQVDREGLAIVFAVQKFRCFVLGRKFTIFTDHKPLLGLLQQGKPIKDCMSPRMTRWSLILSSYDYELRYRPGESIGAADALSRLPAKDDSACAEPMPQKFSCWR